MAGKQHIKPKELGQRTDKELAELFGDMYTGWDRGVDVHQERFGDGETRFTETPMSRLGLAARYVAAEIGINIYEIVGRAAFAPIIVYSQIQARIGPLFEELERASRNRDMWRGQCERQAARLTDMRKALDTIARTTFSGDEMGDDYRRGNRAAHETCARLARAAIDKDDAAHPGSADNEIGRAHV